jgi:hypothetical protein
MYLPWAGIHLLLTCSADSPIMLFSEAHLASPRRAIMGPVIEAPRLRNRVSSCWFGGVCSLFQSIFGPVSAHPVTFKLLQHVDTKNPAFSEEKRDDFRRRFRCRFGPDNV